jgi:tripartite-type tricarboxylate transporter receptor subunit TctC
MKTTGRLTTALGALVCAMGIALAQTSWAQPFPSRPVTLYVPFVAGTTDTLARKVAEIASRQLGQPVVVENKPGAGGTLGPVLMARTGKPDGYLLSLVPSSLFRYPYLQKVDWDPIRDFTYIAGLSVDAMSFQTYADSPIKNFNDMVQWARANPGKLTYGTPGAGTSMHLLAETSAAQLGIQVVHVPYKGGSDLIKALLAHETMVTADTAGTIFPQVAGGKARYLVQFNETRASYMKDVPTAKEVGLDMVYTIGVGVAGPKGMPEAIVNRLHDAFRKGLDDPDTLKLLDTLKKDPWPLGPAAYTAWARASYQQERAMVERAGMMAK